jgi:hypothetical protein
MKTLKYEEVYRQEYRDLAEARTSIEYFIEKVYNQKRLHSALGYQPPAEIRASAGGGFVSNRERDYALGRVYRPRGLAIARYVPAGTGRESPKSQKADFIGQVPGHMVRHIINIPAETDCKKMESSKEDAGELSRVMRQPTAHKDGESIHH